MIPTSGNESNGLVVGNDPALANRLLGFPQRVTQVREGFRLIVIREE